MNPQLHAFFLDPSASGHFMHTELSEAYRRACEQAGAQHELIAYTDEFGFLLDETRDLLRDENEYPEYTSQLADFRTALSAIDARRAQVADIDIEISQSLQEIEDLYARDDEGLLTAEDPDHRSWLDNRARILTEVERLLAIPGMAPHLHLIATNLDSLTHAELNAPYNRTLTGFFLDDEASDHEIHARLAPAYRLLSEQAGDRLERLPFANGFEDFLDAIQGYLRDPDRDIDPEYRNELTKFFRLLRALEYGPEPLNELRGSITQSLDDLQTLEAEAAELSSADAERRHDVLLTEARAILATAESYSSHPVSKPHADRILTNLPELANAIAPAPLTEAPMAIAPAPAADATTRTEPDLTENSKGAETPRLTWAGIGSRGNDREPIPPSVLADMTELARRMAADGWHLSSGGADGSDTAFASGTPVDQRTIRLPWPGYNDLSGPDCHPIPQDRLQQSLELAERFHPTWDRCTQGARKLHARNGLILLGRNLDKPVHAVVAYTQGGKLQGGAALGLRIAMEHGIPIFNLGSMTMEEAWKDLQELRHSLTAGQSVSAGKDRTEPDAHRAATDASNMQEAGRKEGMARVLHLRNAPPDAIRIDRRTPWGNPFRIGPDGTREDVISKYRDHLWNSIRNGEISKDALAELHGKNLACHCAPQPCHGDVLASAAAWANANRNRAASPTAAEEARPNPAAQPATRPAARPEVRSYNAGDSCVFRFTRDEWGIFSNFHPSMQAIDAAGHRFATSEHLYQAAKFRGSPDVQARIAGAASARDAAGLGRDPANGPDAGWNDRRIDAMRWVIRMKRETNPELVDAALEKTGDRPIVEFSRNDSFWGAQPQGRSLVGQNVLGSLWMELRDHIRTDDPRALASAWEDPVSPTSVTRASTADTADALPISPRLTTRRQFLETAGNAWAAAHENPAAVAGAWQRIKMDYASLYTASGDRMHHLPYQEGFAEFRDLVAGAVQDGACPPEHRDRLKALHETLETQGSRHDAVHDAHTRLNDVGARLDDLKEKMGSEPGQTIETMPGYTGWLRDRDAAVAHWRELAADPAHKEHMQILAPDMMAPQIAELSNAPLTSIHRASAEYPVPSSGQGVYTPSLQPLSQVYDRALAFVDRDPNLLPYAPQFDELKTAVSKALDECRHAPDLLDRLTNMRAALDDSHERMTRAQAATRDIADASQALCTMKSWSERSGMPIHEAPNFNAWRDNADRALRHYEAAEHDPGLALYLARADSLGVLAETAVPMLRDPRFQTPVASEASLAASRRRSEETEEQYSMSA